MSQSDWYESNIGDAESVEQVFEWWGSLDRGWKANLIALLIVSALLLI